MGRGGARSGGVRASPGRAGPDALFSAWPRLISTAAVWSGCSPAEQSETEVLGACADTRCASLIENQGKPCWDAGSARTATPQQGSLFGAVGCQRNRPADGNSCTLFNKRTVPAFRDVDGAWVGCSVEQRRKAVAGCRSPFGGRGPARRWIPFHANTTDIQSCGSGRRIPFAGCRPLSRGSSPAACEVWQLPG